MNHFIVGKATLGGTPNPSNFCCRVMIYHIEAWDEDWTSQMLIFEFFMNPARFKGQSCTCLLVKKVAVCQRGSWERSRAEDCGCPFVE